MLITDDPVSVRKILRVIDCCVILHNLLLDSEAEEPDEWLEDVDDEASEIGTALGEYEYVQFMHDGLDDDARRTRCLELFRDHRII